MAKKMCTNDTMNVDYFVLFWDCRLSLVFCITLASTNESLIQGLPDASSPTPSNSKRKLCK